MIVDLPELSRPTTMMLAAFPELEPNMADVKLLKKPMPRCSNRR
jgi:hypothetical protein